MDSNNSAITVAQSEPRALDTPVNLYAGGYVPVSPQPSFIDYFRILMKRRWVLITTVLVGTTLVSIATFKMKPRYEAVGRIAINRENVDLLGLKEVQANSSEDFDYNVVLDTQVKILQSDELAMQVVRALRLDENPAFYRKNVAANASSMSDTDRELDLLSAFRNALKVSKVPRTRVIEIRFLSPDRKTAADAVNTLVSSFVEQNFKTKYEATMQTSEWLSKQLVDLRRKVETSQEQLIRYQKENEILGISDKQNIVTAKLSELNQQLTAAEGERMKKQAAYQLAGEGNPDLISNAAENRTVQRLTDQESDLKGQYAQMSTQLGPSHPKLVELKNQLREVQTLRQAELSKIVSRIHNDYREALERERVLRAAFERQKAEANQLNEKSIQYTQLSREFETNRQLYENLLQKLKEAGVSAGLRSGNIRIVDVARAPKKPAKPNVPLNLALGFLASVTLGVSLVFVVEHLDNSLRDPEEIQLIAGLPLLGLIPRSQPEKKQRKDSKWIATAKSGELPEGSSIVSLTRPKSKATESYKSLRTSILLSSSETPPKVIMITSGLPQEGKTTTSINTAVVLAQKGSRVLLIDADMRRPSVHLAFGIPSEVGLSTLLAGGGTFEEVAIPAPQLPNLLIIPAGPPPPQPPELLDSRVMKNYLAGWRSQFDYIIIDTPPVLSVTDPVLLSVEADSVVLVIRAGRSTKASLRRSRELLTHVNAKVLGVVVNAVDLEGPGNYYYYGYYGTYGTYGGCKHDYYDDSRA